MSRAQSDIVSTAGTSDTSSANSSSDEYNVFTSDQGSSFNDSQDASVDMPRANKEKEKVDKTCSCVRYIRPRDSRKKVRRKHPGQMVLDPELEKALRSLGDFDVMHCFAAVLAGALNLAKMILRLHFSIDPQAYQHLPK